MDLNELASFVRVVGLGTITAAAAAEGVPKSTISRRIARLEEQLGVTLLQRSARAFTVTEDGRLLYDRAVGSLRELESVENALADRAETPSGTLVVTAPADMGRAKVFAELVAQYRARYPLVTLKLRLEQRVIDLAHEGVDVAIRPHGATIPGGGDLMSRRVASTAAYVYASPAFWDAHQRPTDCADIRVLPSVLHTSVVSRWDLDDPERPPELGDPVVIVNDFETVRELLELGVGIGVLPSFVGAPAVRGGALVRAAPDWVSYEGQVSLLWPSSRHLAPRVRAFVDLAAEVFPRYDEVFGRV